MLDMRVITMSSTVKRN